MHLPVRLEGERNTQVRSRDLEAAVQGCTDLVEETTRLRWKRYQLLEQRNILLERRLGLLEKLQQEYMFHNNIIHSFWEAETSTP